MTNETFDTCAIERQARALRAAFIRDCAVSLMARLRELRHRGHATA